jgi:hypothetical protein
MKCAMGMGSDGMIYIPSLIKIGSSIKKLLGGDTYTDIQTRRQQRDVISLVLFFQNTVRRLVKLC